jgi:PilZ domain
VERPVGDERRRTPRYPFIATAEVIDQSSQARISTRVTELSLHGCYVEMPNPFPKDTPIKIKIYSEGKFFESNGVTVYSQPNLGIGVTFREMRPQFLSILKQWLLAAAVAKYGPKS